MSSVTSRKDIPFLQKPKKSTSSQMERLLHENEQLESQKIILQNEVQDLLVKNDNLVKALNLNKERFEEDFNKLQEEIRQNEDHLVENSRKCLDQQKKYADEVKKLKQENDSLKRSKNETEKFFTEKLKALESELKLLKLENENLHAQNRDNEQKSLKYKTKLKHAVKIVNEMNQIIEHNRNRPEITCNTTQTECDNIGDKNDKTSIQDCSQCGDPRYKRDLNSENLMLSDIFFKKKSFVDSELDLFSSKSKNKFPSDTGL